MQGAVVEEVVEEVVEVMSMVKVVELFVFFHYKERIS
jgi:hypothetical protein